MRLTAVKALITGGSGGIGSAIAEQILAAGGAVLLVGRDAAALEEVGARLAAHSERMALLVADVTNPTDASHLCAAAQRWRGGINVLINNAGVSDFGCFSKQDAALLERTIAVNLLAPMQLCRALLPHLLKQPAAQILNIGSVFGAIGHPGFAAYSASKFGLRGFSEALRRELAATRVTVQYLAPRATRTAGNDARVTSMNGALGITMDSPQLVARHVQRMLSSGVREAVIGWPEKLFAKINALFPRLVDSSLRKKLPVIESYAGAAGTQRGPSLKYTTSRHSL